MEKFKSIIKSSFGQQLPIRQRFFNIIFICGFVLGIAGTINCIAMNSSEQATLISAATAIIFPLLTYVGIRAKEHQNVIIYFALFVVNFFVFPSLYLCGGEIHCGIPIFFVLGLALILFLTTGITSIILTVVTSLYFLFIFFVSWKYPAVCMDVPAFSTPEGLREFAFNDIMYNVVLVCIALGVIAKIIFNIYQKERKIVEASIKEVERQSIIDPLTAVYNRRYMYSFLDTQIKKSRTENMPLSVAIFDIDKFKDLNDTYGHLLGDVVLKALASILKNSCREGEIVARYGGEEFILILPGIELDAAADRAEKLRLCIEQSYLSPELPKDKPVTVSAGVSTFQAGYDIEDMIAIADTRLYKAKETGRNKVISEGGGKKYD
ncbi:MAG: GGDEF domain-containing protein [Ruminococcaceae bacterium]|nr:GGDEF domain-containing protein [Oscillospiraceae bacterium]